MGFHIVKRENLPLWQKCRYYLAAVAFALLLGGALLIALGVDPVAYAGMRVNTIVLRTVFLSAALIGLAATFSQVDSSFANMLQGVILFLVLAADFYTRFKIVPVKKGGA